MDFKKGANGSDCKFIEVLIFQVHGSRNEASKVITSNKNIETMICIKDYDDVF
jgi:hypothetical protein